MINEKKKRTNASFNWKTIDIFYTYTFPEIQLGNIIKYVFGVRRFTKYHCQLFNECNIRWCSIYHFDEQIANWISCNYHIYTICHFLPSQQHFLIFLQHGVQNSALQFTIHLEKLSFENNNSYKKTSDVKVGHCSYHILQRHSFDNINGREHCFQIFCNQTC